MSRSPDVVGEFLAEIRQFLAESRMPTSRLGLLALNDTNSVFEFLSRRRTPSLKTAERVRAAMATWRRQAAQAARRKRQRGAQQAVWPA